MIAASLEAYSQAPAALSKEQWRTDLAYLARELPAKHKNAFHAVSKEQFETAVSTLNTAIPNLAEHEILIGLRRIVAMIGDAHTALEPPKNFHRYPLTLYWFGHDLRVLRTTGDYKQALGTKVVAIGGLKTSDAAQRVNTLVAAESEQFIRYADVGLMPMAEVLSGLKIVPDLDHAQWTFEGDDGKRFSLDIKAVPQDAGLSWLSTLKQLPLYRENFDQLMWTKGLPDAGLVYLNLKAYPDADTFKKVSEKMFRVIDDTKANRLVIDVRQSMGGDFLKFRSQIIRALEKREAFRKPNSLFVIIGRSTISAAMVNAIDLRDGFHAIIVGEPSGSRPNSYSENGRMTLPNSRLEITFSTKYYKLQTQDTASLMPDKLIEPEWESYTAGRDPVMEWILMQPMP